MTEIEKARKRWNVTNSMDQSVVLRMQLVWVRVLRNVKGEKLLCIFAFFFDSDFYFLLRKKEIAKNKKQRETPFLKTEKKNSQQKKGITKPFLSNSKMREKRKLWNFEMAAKQLSGRACVS